MLRIAGLGGLLAAAVFVVSCSGSVSTTPVAGATASAAPAAASTSIAVPTTGGVAQLATTSNGQVASLGFTSGAPSGITLSASSSITAPSSAPVPSSVRRQAAAIAGAVPFYFVTFTVSGPIAATYFTSELVTLTTQPLSASYYAEFDDITSSPSTKLACFGPGTVGSSVTIQNTVACGTGNTAQPTLVNGHTYLLQFYYVPSSGASPSPSPSPSPTATATATATPTPTSTPNLVQTSVAYSTINGFAGPGLSPGLTATYSFGSVTWGNATAGVPSINFTSAPPSGTMTVNQWGKTPANGCTPANGGTVLYGIEFTNLTVSTGALATSPLFDTGLTTTATLPAGTYYALVASEGSTPSVCTVIQQDIRITNGVAPYTGAPTSGASLNVPTTSAVTFAPGNTYVIELYYR